MTTSLTIGLLMLVVLAESSCPSGWIPERKSCFFLSHSNQATWAQAEVYCRSHGGYLVDINDVTEDTFVRGLAVLSGAELVWLGATDQHQEGRWISSKTHEPLTYFGTWVPGEPNNDKNNEHCLNLWRDHKYLWNDGNCGVGAAFICERSA